MAEPTRPTAHARGLRASWRRLAARPGPVVAGVLTLGLGVGMGLPLLHAGAATTLAGGTTGPGWWPGWTAEMLPPEAIRQAGADALIGVLLGLTIAFVGVVVLNLLVLELSRSADRRHEAAVRSALGATRVIVRRQRLAEALLRVTPGLLLAGGLATVVWSILAATRPEALTVGPDGRPLLLAAVVALGLPLATVLAASGRLGFGRRTPPRAALGAGPRATAERGELLVRGLVGSLGVGGVVVLLVTAGLLLRAAPGTGADEALPGAGSVLTFQVDLPKGDPAAAGWQSALDAALAAVPGVASSALASTGALLDLGAEDRVRTACEECSRAGMWAPMIEGRARLHAVSPGFFDTVGVGVRRGREFAGTDVSGEMGVAVMNRSATNRLYPGGDPLGKPIRVGGEWASWRTVVGVVDDLPAAGLGAGGEPISSVYLSTLQHPPGAAHLAVRTAPGAAPDTARQVERALAQAGVVALPLGTLETLRRDAAAPVRWLSTLLLALGTAAVVVAAVGLHALVRAQLQARRRELALRVAVGASPIRTLAWVVVWVARSLLAGATVGLLAAFSLARLLQLLVPGLRPLDPIVYAAAGLLVTLVVLLALAGPALRAAAEHPGKALRGG